MGSCCCRIERVKNGFEVCMTDPEIVKANREPSKKGEYKPYRNPDVEYVFKTVEEVLNFLKTALPKAVPDDSEYESAFDNAAKDAADD